MAMAAGYSSHVGLATVAVVLAKSQLQPLCFKTQLRVSLVLATARGYSRHDDLASAAVLPLAIATAIVSNTTQVSLLLATAYY